MHDHAHAQEGVAGAGSEQASRRAGKDPMATTAAVGLGWVGGRRAGGDDGRAKVRLTRWNLYYREFVLIGSSAWEPQDSARGGAEGAGKANLDSEL